MKLTFNFVLKGLDGKPITNGDVHAGKILAQVLANLNGKGNSMKLWDWAQKLYNKSPIEIDETDAKVLEALIDASEHIPVLTKAPLLEHIEEQRKKDKK